MKIRKTTIEDLEIVLHIYEYARGFMESVGNGNQWIDGYPSPDLISEDINQGNSYICEDKEKGIVGTFYFRIGDDPTYAIIYDGEWLNDKPYGVVHRMAGNGAVKGIGAYCLEWCFSQCENIRVDTHHDNIVMQNLLKKLGYKECGIIIIANGTERIAFQKSKS